MNTQCSSVVSLTGSKVYRSTAWYRSHQKSGATLPSQRQQIISEGWVNAAAFERFLYWLGPDSETAGRKYELIRCRLIMMFRARRCVFAEDLADATFERVARKLTELTTEFTGDPARYFYGVAKKIYLEYQREITAVRFKSESLPTNQANTENPDLEKMLKQLDEALSAIPDPDRELILQYYTDSGRNKINHRRALGEQFGIGLNALRLRVFRIRRKIKNYMSRSIPSWDADLIAVNNQPKENKYEPPKLPNRNAAGNPDDGCHSRSREHRGSSCRVEAYRRSN